MLWSHVSMWNWITITLLHENSKLLASLRSLAVECKRRQLLFYNSWHSKPTLSRFVNLKKISTLLSIDCKRKKRNLFCVFKHNFIYFTNSFYNSPYIPIFIFTYHPIKEYKLPNKIIKSILFFLFLPTIFSLPKTCCEILKHSQVYEPYQSIVWQERGQIHRDSNECRKIN